MSPVLGVVLLTVALSGGAIAFAPIGGEASSHVSITGTALLQKVRETCRAVAESSGHEFNPTGNSPEEIVQACLGPRATGVVSAVKFRSALNEIYVQNGLVDCDFDNSPPHHFNNEAFLEGRGLITEGVASIKANIRNQNFQAARETLGRVLHTLQDFYSHSNWVELGFTAPYINLIRPDLPLENLAERDAATCSDCASGTCPNPILPIILREKKLTSGYMGIFSAAKPKGKCSHGGAADLTSTVVPRGGINKDERRPDNVAFHTAAVNLATSASLQLLEDIRGAAGNDDFLRMVGIVRASVVCFVVDTTGSMSDDIAEVRRLISQIIDSTKGTQDEPSEYILVPFNDPEFGPITRTPHGDVMKVHVSKLTASGGGDTPEMCLSGLQLALTGAPASSQIYVFTDATAKDIALKDTIVALIRSSKSTVSFFMTGSSRRRRRSLTGSFNDYKELALASGGQAIEVSKRQLHQATDIILDTTTSALVTVLQRDRSAGTETFPFVLDGSLTYVTLYITGSAILFTLTNPGGVIQRQSEASGNLGTIQAKGNLWRIRLNADKRPGTWQISISTSYPYTLKVTGQSVITFIYNFVKVCQGHHPGYAVITGRPNAGQPATLLISVMGKKGPNSVSIHNVGLGKASGAEAMSRGTTTDMGNGDILVTVASVPEGDFVVMLNGIDSVSGTRFQRQSTTQISVSKVTIKAAVDSSLEPGKTFSLPLSVMTQGSGGTYSIIAKNDKGFAMTYPSSITLTPGQYANVILTITPPGNTPSGTDVTLTIDVKSSSGSDSNSAVLRRSVVSKRQSTTTISVSKVTIKAAVDSSLEPGKTFSLPLSVMTQGSGGTYSIIAKNDKGFAMRYPSSITLTPGQYANVILTITPPGNTPSGTDVTLTIDVKSSSGSDSNSAVLRRSVVSKRQSTTPISVSKVTIKAAVDSSLEPGKTFSLPLSVMTQGSGGTYSIIAKNDKGFAMTYPPSITLTPGQYANVILTITPPGNTPSGTDVTLTIDVKSSSGSDSNSAVLRRSVVSKVLSRVTEGPLQKVCESVSALVSAACEKQADLVMLMDRSSGIDPNDYTLMKTFVTDLLASFNVSKESVRVGVAQFSSSPQKEFDLNEFYNETEVKNQILAMNQLGGGDRNIGRALEFIQDYFQASRGSRKSQSISQNLVLITDGRSQDAVEEAAANLHAQGIEVFAIGARHRHPDDLELLQITGSSNHSVFTVQDFSSLACIKEKVVKTICDSIPDRPETTTLRPTSSDVTQALKQWFNGNMSRLEFNDVNDPSCHPVAVMPLNGCGTTLKEDEENLVFRNQTRSAKPADTSQVISRACCDVQIAFSCVYPERQSALSLRFKHESPCAFTWRGYGDFSLQFEFYESEHFRRQKQASSYPVTLNQTIYMQIQANTSIPGTQLFVESCKATPYDNPLSEVTYNIIEHGCKRDDTLEIYNGSNSQFRFGMKAFTFIGAYEQVYINCSVMLCQTGLPGSRCSQGCISGNPRGKRHANANAQSDTHSISQGPLQLIRADDCLGSGPSMNVVLIVGCVLVCGVVCGVVVYHYRRTRGLTAAPSAAL